MGKYKLCGFFFVNCPIIGLREETGKRASKTSIKTSIKSRLSSGQSWLKTKTNVQILDTPGILWPKFSDQEVGYKLAALRSNVILPNFPLRKR